MVPEINELFKDRSDQSIIRLVRGGHKEIFEILIWRYQKKLINFFTRLTGSIADAEDLAQETFINVYFNLNKFDLAREFSPWLFSIGHHLAINHHHKNNKIRIIDLERLPDIPDLNSNNGLEQLFKDEQRELIEEKLEKIDGKYRVILELRYLKDKSYAQIAEILNLPVNTVKSRIFRAKNSLANIIGTLT